MNTDEASKAGKTAPTGRSPHDGPPATPGASGAPGNQAPPREIGGPKGPDPTRYGDWEVNGRCIDF